MDISQQQREEGVKFICDEIEHVIKEFGDRDPGSEGENKALDYMKSQLDEFSDETHRESYKVAPHAFFGWTYITATCALIAIITLFFAPVVSVVLLVLGLLPMIGEFVFYKEAIDFLFKKRTSGNVMGTIKPTGEVKRRVVLNGHSDAVYEWHWHYVGGYKLFLTSIIIPVIAVIYIAVTAIVAMAMNGVVGTPSGAPLYMAIASVIFVPALLCFYMFADHKTVVPGANDNLTACYMAIAMLKLMHDNDIRFEHTEVVALVTGSEEAGLRGAKAFCKLNPEYGLEPNIETIFVTYETLRELEHLVIYNRDLNGTVKVDMPTCELVKRAAAKNGMDLKYGSVFAGANAWVRHAHSASKAAAW